MLQPGDIFATSNTSLMGKLARKLMAPETDRFHFGMILAKIDDDYLILESIGKGIAIGRLSFYDGVDIKFYRPTNCTAEAMKLAPIALTKYGRAEYDTILILKIMLQGFWLVFKHLIVEGKLRPIYPWELSWCKNNRFICTEAVDVAYDLVGNSIIPDELCPVPSAYKWAELEGEITELSKAEVG